MMLEIAEALCASDVEAVCEALADEALWRDGAATAAGAARRAKRNEQAASDAPAVVGAREMVRARLFDHAVIASAARPAAIVRLLFSRYRPGMAYGPHVDAAYIDGVRADVSFTVFLSDPATYDGGELVVETPGAEDAVKPAAGTVALYPSTSVHYVAPVTRGERLAAVGWINSKVRNADDRAILFEFDRALADLRAIKAPDALSIRFANLRNNLLRRFGD